LEGGVGPVFADVVLAIGGDAVEGEGVELFGLGDGQRAEENGVDEAESGGAGADGEGEGENGGGGSDFAFEEDAAAEDGVGAEGVEPRQEADVARGFAIVERRAEGAAGFFGVTALEEGFVEVGLEFFVDVAVQAIGAKRVVEAGEEGHVRWSWGAGWWDGRRRGSYSDG
jgi:hypothetical protein